MALSLEVARPQRWQEPFGARPLTHSEVERILATPPFDRVNPEIFPAKVSLRGLVANDMRIEHRRAGDIVFQAGDYGTSVFFVLSGIAFRVDSTSQLSAPRPEEVPPLICILKSDMALMLDGSRDLHHGEHVHRLASRPTGLRFGR